MTEWYHQGCAFAGKAGTAGTHQKGENGSALSRENAQSMRPLLVKLLMPAKNIATLATQRIIVLIVVIALEYK
jgi:hypothetical protein